MDIYNIISNNNTEKIKYIIIFFIVIISLSNNLFLNIFGCNNIIKNKYINHFIMIFFLYLLFDININDENVINPLLNLFYTLIIYIFVIMLFQTNKFYITLVFIILLLLLILDKFKIYYSSIIKDQEKLQETLELIYKTNNIFIILIILIGVIGLISTFNYTNFKNTFTDKKC